MPEESTDGQRLRGVIPPLVLPLDPDGGIDFDSLDRQIQFLLTGGVDGLWVNGTTGDFFALGIRERAEVVAAAVRAAAGRVPVIAQVGDASTRRAITHAQRALDAGADALAVVLPYYLEYSQRELKGHYRLISRAVQRPLFLYQLPQMCKVSLTIPSILELAREGTLLGIKDSAGDVDFYGRLLRRVADEHSTLRCFYGAGPLLDVSLFVGGHGVMCAIANLVPHLCKRVVEAAARGDWGAARAAQQRVLGLIDRLGLPGRSNWAPSVAVYKWMLQQLGVIAHAGVLDPLEPLTAEEQEMLAKDALPTARALCGELLSGLASAGSRNGTT